MITDRLRSVGQFEIRLKPTVTRHVLKALSLATGAFGSIIVTDNRIGRSDLTVANLRANARWHGILRSRPDDLTLEGAGLGVLLGDEDNKGPVLSSRISKAGATLSSCIGDILPANGISAGTVTNTGLATITAEVQYVTVRQALELFCDTAGASWRINPGLTLDAAAPATLYANYTTPKVIISPLAKGRSYQPYALKPSFLGLASDAEDWSSKVYYLARGDEILTVATATIGANPYKAPGSASDLRMERVIDSSGTTTTDASSLAAAQLGRFTSTRRALDCRTTDPQVMRYVKPGDRVYLYDAALNLVDSANTAYLDGQEIKPLLVTVVGLSWAVQPRMGVYFIPPVGSSSEASNVYDLSEDIDYELVESVIELGEVGVPVDGGPLVSGAGPFGDVAITAYDAWPTTAATFIASSVNPNIGSTGTTVATVNVVGKECSGAVRTTIGGTGITSGTGNYGYSGLVPSNVRTNTYHHAIGHAIIGGAIVPIMGMFSGTGINLIIRTDLANSGLNSTSPGLTSGDEINLEWAGVELA